MAERFGYDEDGRIIANSKNIRMILINDENLKDKVSFNEFSMKININGPLPWRKSNKGDIWSYSNDSSLRVYLNETYDVYSKSKIDDAFVNILHKNIYLPVKCYLDLFGIKLKGLKGYLFFT